MSSSRQSRWADHGVHSLSPVCVELNGDGWLGTHDLVERERRHADCRTLLRDLTSGTVIVTLRRDSFSSRSTVSFSPSLRYLYVWTQGIHEVAGVEFSWADGPLIFVSAPATTFELPSGTAVLPGAQWTLQRAPDAKT